MLFKFYPNWTKSHAYSGKMYILKLEIYMTSTIHQPHLINLPSTIFSLVQTK
jgi:hypothetical protein